MSIKTFFEKVGKEIEKLFGSATFEQKVQATISYVGPVIETVVGLADPAAAPIVTSVINTTKADLATISTLVQGGTAAPGSTAAKTIQTAIDSIKTNLSGLLQVAEVKNSAKSSQITTSVNLVTGEMDALLAGLTS